MVNSTVLSIDSNFLLLDTYSVSDENLIANQEITSTFSPETDYIEYYIYGLNNSLLSPYFSEESRNIGIPYNSFSLLNGELYINPSSDLETSGFEKGSYNVLYNFYSNRLNSSYDTNYFISEISSDRTEIRLDSNIIEDADIISSVTEFIAERTADEYYPDFLLNFGSNKTVIANNIALDGNTVLIKLYEPLPQQFGLKSTLWVVEEVAESIAYNITFEEEELKVDDTSIQLKGPNVNLDLKDQINNSTEAASLSSLNSSPLTSSYQQLQSLFQEGGLQINVDYTEYSNFILNSSIEARLENFEYKLQLIESYTKSAQSGSNVPGTTAVSGSKTYYTSLIDDVITNFDGYEYFLYFESGSKSWPKANSEPPYRNLATTDITAINWYNEQIASASLYDELNLNSNYYDVPEYLRNDPSNQGYIDFVNMIGQHFDNIWIYLKDISNKYNADNRINAGVSKDLVAQILRDFSLKIYQNNFSSKDVYSSFLGLTPNGSLFPFPEMTGSLPTPTGFEYVDTFISSSTDAIPLDDVNKRIYKRLYHNLPYLLKSKGTIQGLKTLLNTYGIPDTILRISEFGGKDKINENDWDYWYNKFNYAYDTQDNGFISSSWTTNSEWGSSPASETVQFRFKTPGVESATTTYSQSLWSLDTNTHVVLEYTGSGLSSGSYSGAIIDPSNQYAHLKFYPDYVNNPNHSASLYLPFFDGGWWSVMATLTDSTASLYAGNKIYNGNTGTELGFYESDSILSVNSSEWDSGTVSIFASESIYPKFSGSLQEIRYYNTAISESRFKDYVMNPLSFEGNSIESGSLDLTPDQLLFRATLGGELYTGSNSIHPKSDGSWTSVYSFPLSSRFYIENGDFSSNKEYIFLDQPAVGLKNRINDKIKTKSLSLPFYNTTEGASIPNANTLSNQASIQQDKFRNDQYTNNVDLLEVTFSPQNEINDDIIQQLGYFNIGNLIGDPREVSSSNQSYPELDKLRQDYFLKYVHENYDFNDYVRLIKFFDNSLFKQIKDFIPAKTSLASGITIKPTILERQKYPLPQAEWEDLQYSGSVKSFARNYETGSLQVVSGGNGGSMPSLAEGSITRVKIGNGGTDFDPAGTYTVTVSGGGGTGAEISIDSVDVASYQLDSGTQLLSQTAQSPPYTPGTYSNILCSTSGLNPIRLTITVNALTQISSIIVDSDTDGFDIGDTITINGSDIGGASNSTITLPLAVLTPVGGEISAISIVNGGRGYTSFPTLTVNGSPGTGADLQVIALGGSQVVQSWDGYNITPSGSVAFTQDDAREFVNGEFSGSTILVEDGELNPDNPLKSPDTTFVQYDVTGSNNTNPGTGEIFWQEGNQPVTQGQFTFNNKVISSLYINENTLNNDSLSTALKNLQVGDTMAFTVRVSLTNTVFFPPTVTFSNKNVIQEISNITRNSSGVWYIEFNIKTATILKGFNDTRILGYSSITSEVIFTPFINIPNFTYSDFNATLGNATDIRPGTIYQDVDYSSDSITPVNFGQILLGEATKANTPDSNYSTKRITIPRYEGSRSTSNDFNLNSNEGGLGVLPNVEQDRAYFAYFNWVGGTAPEWGNGLEDRSAFNIRYFIDSEGNVIEPTNDSKGVNLSITRQTFTEGETGVLSFDDESGTSSQFQNLVGEQTIFKSGKSITPIVYSQTQSISDTTPGGATGSLAFIQGDQAESTVGDYRSTAYATSQFITNANVPFSVSFPSQQYLGDEGSFTLNSIYSSSIDASPNTTLKFEAYIEAGITTQNGSSAVFHIQKNSNGAGWVNVSSGYNILEPGVNNNINITYYDPNSTDGDDYRVRVTSANINTNLGPAGYIEIDSTSYFKVTQTPPPSIGDVGPGAGTGNYWSLVGGAPAPYTNRKIKPNALMAVYGQKQKDIENDINNDPTGFSSIVNDFVLQVGDEVRFQGTETQTYKIVELDNTPANGDPLHLVLDREINLTNTEMNWFLVRRYIDTPGQIIIEADKPAGGTSPGFFMPLYATKGIEDNFDKVIQQLKTDQLI